MKFGVFDHMDANGASLGSQINDRLRIVEAYDRAGIYCYHVAEHHSTPLGNAPSPGIYLAAVAQRTRNLRFGPLVYLLPFYHPLRLVEEVCMLDQMSGGRFQLGIGRGISPVEAGFYGIEMARGRELYEESYQILLKGLSEERLTFQGKHFSFNDVPMTLKPVQRPHPPLWYGLINPDTTKWAAANDVNVVCLLLAPEARKITDRYRAEWAALGKPADKLPLMGTSRHIVVADDDATAKAIAARAYPKWRDSFNHLWRIYAPNAMRSPIAALYPESFEALAASGNACAGSPETVKKFLREQIEISGVNYMACWFAFGDLSVEESLRSVELFGAQVIPALKDM